MKKVVALICGVTTLIIIMLILLTIQGRDIRQTELDNAVDSSMEKAMSMLYAEDGLAPETNDELVALFMEALVVQIDSASDLEVDILAVDVEKGLLSVEAKLIYTHPIGTQGVVTCMRTAIKDQYWDSGLVGDFSVTFLVDEEIFKSYTFSSGQGYIDPGVPEKEGYTFLGWKLIGTNDIVDITSYVADENRTFVAEFSQGVMTTLAAGIYSSNNQLLATWDELIQEGTVTETEILRGAFFDTTSNYLYTVVSLIIPEGVTIIGDEALRDNPLNNITIPSTVTSIGYSAFMDDGYLETINYNGTQAEWNSIEFGGDWNSGCQEITVHCTDGDIIIPAY